MKKFLWLLSPLALGLSTIGYLIYSKIPYGIFLWSGPLFIYGLIPMMDFLVGEDKNNPDAECLLKLQKEAFYYDFCLFLGLTVLIANFIFGIYVYGSHFHYFNLLDKIGWILSVGGANGLGINLAHELGHKTNKWKEWGGKLALAPSLYGHFYTEHNRGHHINVATPIDPATSKLNQTFYAFLPKTIIGTFISALKIEKQRKERFKLKWYNNHNIQAWSLSLLFIIPAISIYGWEILSFIIPQAFYAVSLLEVVNYIEHYGLCRKKLENGKYERTNQTHSWNSNFLITNLFLYQLQRHSDHHANASKRYETLLNYENSPQMPSGYATMILMAYLPKLWFKIMNPKVLAYYQKDGV